MVPAIGWGTRTRAPREKCGDRRDVPRYLHATEPKEPPQSPGLFLGAQPILQSQPLDPGEFSFVVGDNHVTKRQRLSRNQQVICADWCARLLQAGTQQPVARV